MEFPLSTSSHDRSVQYLFEIFGPMGGVLKGWVGGVQSTGGDADTNILSAMFTTFNTLVLAIAAIILIYVTIKGVIQTAHEGEMMGKQGSALWTPIKMVLGVAALVPTATGYSAIQIIMMWIIVQGIAVADMVWGTALEYVNIGGSVQAKFKIPRGDVTTNLTGLFSAMTCHATFAETLIAPESPPVTVPPAPPLTQGVYYCSIEANRVPGNAATGDPDPCEKFAYDPSKSTQKLGPEGACGTLTTCNLNSYAPGTLGHRVCQKQLEVLGIILAQDGLMAQAANLLEKTDYSYRNFYAKNDPSAGADFNGGWIKEYCRKNNVEPCCVPGAGTGDKKCNATINNFEKFPPNDNSVTAGWMYPPKDTVNGLYASYSIFPALSGGASSPDSIDFMTLSIDLYQDTIQKEVNDYLSEQGAKKGIQQTNNNIAKVLNVADETGWIMAGAFYNILAQQNNDNFKQAIPKLEFKAGRDLQSVMGAGSLSMYRNNYKSASDFLSSLTVEQAKNATGGAAASPETCPFSSDFCGAGSPGAAVGTALVDTSDAFTNNLQSGVSDTNPLVAMQQTGYALLIIAGIAFIALLIALILVSTVANLNGWVAGTGGFLPLGPAITVAAMLLIPAIGFLLGILVLVGGTFAVYIPMIPYIIFTTGAIGWLLACIEAMVAGPLVALGILAPGGHHDILGKAEPALMLLFNIFLRPSLMIFGLIASMLLATVVIVMINSGFGLLITSMGDLANTAGGTATNYNIDYDAAGNPYIPGGAAALAFNPVMLVLILIAYIGIITTAMNKCFSAIHVIPERVMSWIGGQGANYGEAEAAGEHKRTAEGGAASVKGKMEAGESRATKFGSDEGKAKSDAKKGANADLNAT